MGYVKELDPEFVAKPIGPCNKCEGTGTIVLFGAGDELEVECPHCGGDGNRYE